MNGSLFTVLGLSILLAYARVMYVIKKNVYDNLDMEKQSLTILILFLLGAYLGRGIFTFTLITNQVQE